MSQELELRFENFAACTRDFCSRITRNVINLEYFRQLIRCSASVAANYIEASDDLGKADEKMKIKIERREAKESALFLRLILTHGDNDLTSEQSKLVIEATEIRKILSAIIKKLE